VGVMGHGVQCARSRLVRQLQAIFRSEAHYSGLGVNNSEVGVYSACVAACLACLRPVPLATARRHRAAPKGTPSRAEDMACGAPLQWLNVLGCALAALVFAGSGCSHTSAPPRANGRAPTPLATATSPQSSPAGPSCGVTITGRHWYRAAPPARNAVLLLGAGPRGIVVGA